LGFTIAIILGRFDCRQLHRSDPTFLSIPLYDMIAFGTLLSLAIYWRKKPELHRLLLFIATIPSCSLVSLVVQEFWATSES
jgi:hypothetical protein